MAGADAMKSSARTRRYLINISLLLAGFVSLLSGFLIQFTYHIGHAAATDEGRIVWGWDRPTWALCHQLSSAVLLAVVAWHLYLNRKPLFAGWKRAGAWRRQSPIFFALFTLAVATAMIAWIAAQVFYHPLAEHVAVEVHDKVVIPMSILLALHVWERRSRLRPGCHTSARQ